MPHDSPLTEDVFVDFLVLELKRLQKHCLCLDPGYSHSTCLSVNVRVVLTLSVGLWWMKAGRVTSERSVIFKHLYQMKFQLAGSDHVFWFFYIFALVEVSDGGYDIRRHTADRLMKTFNLNLVFDMLISSRVDQSSFSERSLTFPDFSDDDDDDVMSSCVL